MTLPTLLTWLAVLPLTLWLSRLAPRGAVRVLRLRGVHDMESVAPNAVAGVSRIGERTIEIGDVLAVEGRTVRVGRVACARAAPARSTSGDLIIIPVRPHDLHLVVGDLASAAKPAGGP